MQFSIQGDRSTFCPIALWMSIDFLICKIYDTNSYRDSPLSNSMSYDEKGVGMA